MGEATLIIAGATVAGNVLQVLKLVIVSAWFGASSGLLDQYFFALNIPLAFQGVIMGALMTSFTPLYVERLVARDEKGAEAMLRSTFGFGMLFFATVCVLVAVAARPLLMVLASGFTGEKLEESVRMLRLLLLFLFLSGMCDLLTTFYNAHRRYFVPAIAPLLLIVVSILYLLVFRSQGVDALVYGLIWGGVAQLALLLAAAPRMGEFRLGASLGFASRLYVPVYRMMLPIAAGLAFGHLNVLIGQSMATRLGDGSVSILGYALRFHDVLFKIFAMSLGAAALPYFSAYFAEKKFSEMSSSITLVIRMTFLALVPLAVVIWFFGAEMIHVVFQRGNFHLTDSVEVGRVWAVFSAGLFFMSATVVFSRALNAMKDLHPLWISTLIAIPLNVILVIVLGRSWGTAGIAAATVCIYFFYCVFYAYRLFLKLGQHTASRLVSLIRPSHVVPVLLFCVLLYALKRILEPYLVLSIDPDPSDRLRVFAVTLGGTAIAILFYSVTLLLLRIPEATTLLIFFRRMLPYAKRT